MRRRAISVERKSLIPTNNTNIRGRDGAGV